MSVKIKIIIIYIHIYICVYMNKIVLIYKQKY